MTKPTDPSSAPISQDELVRALEAAGYPLEIEVFKRLQEASLSPVLGMRWKVRDEGGVGGYTTSEVDLLAQSHVRVPSSPSVRGAHVRLRAFIDVKKMHTPRSFAGICGIERQVAERRLLRCRVSGSPAWDLFSHRKGGDTVWAGPDGFATCLDPMNEGLWCVHWAVVCRRRDKVQSKPWPVVAIHEDGFHDALVTLERASLEAGRSWTDFLATRDVEDAHSEINIALNAPTIILDTAQLYAMDANSRKLTEVKWLTIEGYTEHQGQVRRSITDIVSLDGLDSWIQAMKQTSERIENWLGEHAHKLKDYAER